MRQRNRKLLLMLANVLTPAAILTFATGFFPYKAFLPGLAEYSHAEYGSPPAAPLDKVIFMVIDALRSDFVYSNESGFKFTQKLIESGAAIPFTAHATSPTITMPRVKALTTGSIPSFIDLILNFAESDTTSNLAHQDTWLAQVKAKEGGKLVMYGDDTWLKLFPDTFARADGTSSFFVADFTEVDNNVTRHVPDELKKDDWNAMILHYLGLDHIGHKAGPRSINMIPKQSEMDAIVSLIYEAIENEPHLQRTVLIVCGDHGMNDGGNHGGSAPGETSPALVFISPLLKEISKGKSCPAQPKQDFEYYDVVEQSDVVPTLAGLLGFPIPLNNLGVVIAELLPMWPNQADQKALLVQNMHQMLNVVKATFPHLDFDTSSVDINCEGSSLEPGNDLRCKLKHAMFAMESTDALNPSQELYDRLHKGSVAGQLGSLFDAGWRSFCSPRHRKLSNFCYRAQEIMSSTVSNYNLARMATGMSMASAACLLAVASIFRGDSFHPRLSLPSFTFLLVTAAYGIMMFASSYVEEEQHFWYWLTSGWLACLCFSEAKHSSQTATAALLLLVFHRITRRWNQTGQKHAGALDIAHTFLPAHPAILWLLIVATYIKLTQQMSRTAAPLSGWVALTRLSGLMLFVLSFMLKVAFTQKDAPELLQGISALGRVGNTIEHVLGLVWASRLVFSGIVVSLVVVIAEERQWRLQDEQSKRGRDRASTLAHRFHDLLTLFLINQTRVPNIPLFSIFALQLRLLRTLNLSAESTTLTTLLMSFTSFFASGGSNAISSIDLSNAYNGISGYNAVAVGVLVFVGNWAGSIWWATAGALLLVETRRRRETQQMRAEDAISRVGSGSTEDGTRELDVQEDYFLSGENVGKNVGTIIDLPERRAREERGDQKNGDREDDSYQTHFAHFTVFTSISTLAVMAACTALRTHLFIWTVFSPKYLYSIAWGFGMHMGVWGGLGGVFWWSGVL